MSDQQATQERTRANGSLRSWHRAAMAAREPRAIIPLTGDASDRRYFRHRLWRLGINRAGALSRAD